MEINNFLERLLAVSPDAITWLVLAVCALLLVFSFWSRRLRDIAPALMVSAGIIGTFWGTFIALGDFQTGAESGGGLDHQAMVESIPKVLGGMKSAFVTSLIGLFFGFGSKIGFRLIPEKMQDVLPHEKDTLDLLKEIKSGINRGSDKSLSSQIERLQAEYRDGAAEIKQSIAGDGDSSVASQLFKLRKENSEGFKNLDARLAGLADAEKIETIIKGLGDAMLTPLNETAKSLKEIKEGIAGNGDSSIASQLAQLRRENQTDFNRLDGRLETLADTIGNSLVGRLNLLITELRETIANQLVKQLEETNQLLSKKLDEMLTRIETALIDQFGKTFKEFNEATQAIKKWQEEHRAHVVQLTDAFQMAAKEITHIRAECERIPATMNSWKGLMDELNENLRSFAHIKKEAEQFLPAIKKHLDSVANDLRESADNFSELKGQIQTLRQEIEKSQQTLTTMANEHAKQIDSTVANIVQKWGEQMVGIAEQLSQEIKNLR